MSIAMFCAPAVIPAHIAVTILPRKIVFLRPSLSPIQPCRIEPKAHPNAKSPLTAPIILAVYELVA
jgi:hypothetical protein